MYKGFLYRTKARMATFENLKKIGEQYNTLPIKEYLDALMAHFNDA